MSNNNHDAILRLLGMPAYMVLPEPDGITEFSKLSQEAQDMIVNCVCGDYPDSPPEMSDELREELTAYFNAPVTDAPAQETN